MLKSIFIKNKCTIEVKDGYFYDIYVEHCYPCNTTTPVWVKSNCEEDDKCLHRCPNREIIYTSPTAANSVLKCPSERPLMDRYFACWSCDEPTAVDMSFNQQRIQGAHYNHPSVVCQGQRYFNDEGILSYPCPKDKSNLSEDACSQCGGMWREGKCF